MTFGHPASTSQLSYCLYNTLTCASATKYHTGVDYSGIGSHDILASNAGKIARVEYMSSTDHGMGNNVIIEHVLPGNIRKYSSYSHLASIEPGVTVGADVAKGQKIGVMGGSGYGAANYWSTHLHFEIKDSPVTNNPSGAGLYWGYTPGNPDGYGYEDPNIYINKISIGPPGDKFLTYIAPDTISVYWIQNNKKYHVLNPTVLNQMRGVLGNGILEWQDTYTIADNTSYTAAQPFIATDGSSNGMYVRLTGTDDVYLINNSTLEHVSYTSCLLAGCFADVIDVTLDIFNMFQLPVSDSVPPQAGTLSIVTGADQVALSWSGFTDNVGVTGYKLVYSNTVLSSCSSGTQLYSGAGTSYTHTGLAPGKVHYYYLCAFDAAGNTSNGVFAGAMPGVYNGYPVATTAVREVSIGLASDGTNYLVGIQGGADLPYGITAQLVSQSGATVGPRVNISRVGGSPVVAFDGTNYLLVWVDTANYPANDIYGQFVSKSGALVGAPFVVDSAPGRQENVWLQFDGSNYFAAWVDQRNGADYDIYGRFISKTGGLGPEIKINSNAMPYRNGLSMAFGGVNHLVLWDAPDSVRARLVGTDGNLYGPEFNIVNKQGTCASGFTIATAAFDGAKYLVAWNDRPGDCTTDQDIYGQFVSTSGALTGPVMTLSAAAGQQHFPFTAFDGTKFLVTWTDGRNDSNRNNVCDDGEGTCYDIYGRYITPSGVLQGGEFIIANDEGNQLVSPVIYSPGKYFLLWTNGDWVDGGVGDVYGDFILTEGASGGAVWSWGANFFGQQGDGTTVQKLSPGQLSTISGASSVAGGGGHSLALMPDGSVLSWGWNGYGQLGNGTWNDNHTPSNVIGLSGVIAIASGYVNNLALKNDGTVWEWGFDWTVELGFGMELDKNVPTQVSGLTNVAAIASRNSFSLVLKSDGTVWAWGVNWTGQLGNGTTSWSLTPEQVPGLTGVVSVAAGNNFSLALKSDGTVWAWGGNGSGQLGNGTMSDSYAPVKVSGLSGVVAISAGAHHALALKSDGTVWAWGTNYTGELGDGTTIDRPVPVQVVGLAGMVSIIAGFDHSFAIKSDGTVWAWGKNSDGKLGDGSTINRHSPVQVSSLSGALAIAAGTNHSLAIASPDAILPIGTISINAGSAYSGSAIVTLNLGCTDASGCAEMQFSNDGSAWSSWEKFAVSKTWEIAPGESVHTVYARFRDGAGNISATYSDSIILDTIPPSLTVNPVSSPVSSADLTLSGTVEAGSTVAVATGTAASDGPAVVTGGTWSYTITGLAAGDNDVVVTATDQAGNTAAKELTITRAAAELQQMDPLSLYLFFRMINGR